MEQTNDRRESTGKLGGQGGGANFSTLDDNDEDIDDAAKGRPEVQPDGVEKDCRDSGVWTAGRRRGGMTADPSHIAQQKHLRCAGVVDYRVERTEGASSEAGRGACNSTKKRARSGGSDSGGDRVQDRRTDQRLEEGELVVATASTVRQGYHYNNNHHCGTNNDNYSPSRPNIHGEVHRLPKQAKRGGGVGGGSISGNHLIGDSVQNISPIHQQQMPQRGRDECFSDVARYFVPVQPPRPQRSADHYMNDAARHHVGHVSQLQPRGADNFVADEARHFRHVQQQHLPPRGADHFVSDAARHFAHVQPRAGDHFVNERARKIAHNILPPQRDHCITEAAAYVLPIHLQHHKTQALRGTDHIVGDGTLHCNFLQQKHRHEMKALRDSAATLIFLEKGAHEWSECKTHSRARLLRARIDQKESVSRFSNGSFPTFTSLSCAKTDGRSPEVIEETLMNALFDHGETIAASARHEKLFADFIMTL